jgi:glucuronoarabinoxylan endo-1,4-beta-xylanase
MRYWLVNLNRLVKAPPVFRTFFVALLLMSRLPASAQLVYWVDQFDPAGTSGYSYSSGQITNVWGNWFGNAFQSLSWDPSNDASNNPASGSLKINLNFNNSGGIPNQFEVFNGFNAITPTLNGLQCTNFQCDVRFAPGSATVTNGGDATFGYLQFGIAVGYDQDYFGGVNVAATNTNWVHVSLYLNASTDTNLQSISDVLIHIYGPTMSGSSTLWVDNIKFTGSPPATTNCVVDWNNVHQRIDGFGASSAWEGSWTTNQADLFFSTSLNVVFSDNLGNQYTNNGVGLSLLRNRIAPAGSPSASEIPTTVETQLMQWAQARGARVWSTPWTPPAGFKSTSDIYDTNQATGGGLYGGSFLGGTATNLAYASQLANYVASMKNTYGVNLYAISIQNEPDASVNTYEACQWTNTFIHDFVTNLYSALVASGVGSTKIMLPESQNWQDYQNLAGPAMTDPSVAADVGIIGDHNYDGANGPANLIKNSYGKALWETEVSLSTDNINSIGNGIYYAQRIFQFMTVAQVNAWHYWWLGGGLLDANNAPTKQLFTIGNYSRFVRPGDYRIDVANHNPITSVSAYKDPVFGNLVIVAINPDPVTVTQVFNLANFTAGSVTPWITSATVSLAGQPAVSVANGSFTYPLPAMSVVSFVGQGFSAPTNIVISSSSYNSTVPAFVLTWNSTAGATYSVFGTNALGGSLTNWPTMITGYPPGGADANSLSYTDTTAAASSTFYRISSP